jgi:hypothetical protein
MDGSEVNSIQPKSAQNRHEDEFLIPTRSHVRGQNRRESNLYDSLATSTQMSKVNIPSFSCSSSHKHKLTDTESKTYLVNGATSFVPVTVDLG